MYVCIPDIKLGIDNDFIKFPIKYLQCPEHCLNTIKLLREKVQVVNKGITSNFKFINHVHNSSVQLKGGGFATISIFLGIYKRYKILIFLIWVRCHMVIIYRPFVCYSSLKNKSSYCICNVILADRCICRKLTNISSPLDMLSSLGK